MPLPDFLHDQDGEIRLVGHRISLHHLLEFYREGDSAEMLRERFPTLPMALIHRVLAHYWEHKDALDVETDRARERLRAARDSGDHLDVDALRARLAARSAAWPSV